MGITEESFGKTADGQAVEIFTLSNSKGMVARLTSFGAILVSLEVPDKAGKKANVVLGFDALRSYEGPHPYFGATVGRFANRIGGARFTIEGKQYTLAANNGPNHLHGGVSGFDKKVWKAETVVGLGQDLVGVKFSYRSPDGEEGYPGNLDVVVTYTLSEANELAIDYLARTDQTTILNLTHHSYFNLAGEGTGDILGHQLQLNADSYLPANDTLIPTGEYASVQGTPLDFRQPRAIGERIARVAGAQFAGGYDHCFILDRKGSGVELAARVKDPQSGRVMEILTTEPGIQLYTGNFLDGGLKGPSGKAYAKHFGFCLEAQHFPDSPNRPQFPSTLLAPGKIYTQRTVHRFSAE